MNTVDFRTITDSYPLAWAARLVRSGQITVYHGSWVDTFNDGFVEGAWTGPFSDHGFVEADIFVGSGALQLSNQPVFCTASHPYEPLFSAKDGNGALFVANSLPLLLTLGGLRLDIDYPYYMHDLSSFQCGLDRAVRQIPTESGQCVRIHRCCRFTPGSTFELEEVRHPPLPPVESFSKYRGFLSRAARLLVRNASAEGRSQTFAPLATLSTGYDSPAAAVIAAEAGANRAVTFSSARDTFGLGSDSGAEVGRYLGLSTSEHDRLEYRGRTDYPEVDFLAAGTGGEDVVFGSLGEQLTGTILFTGFAGDSLWAKYHPSSRGGIDFVTGDLSGSSLCSYRIRAGFIHFPVPLCTYTQKASLRKISNSHSMEAWSVSDDSALSLDTLLGRVGPGYDRPIPRRIVEEAGVPRELFGRTKRAVSQPFYHDENLEEIMSEHSHRDFQQFLDRYDLPLQGLPALVHDLASHIYSLLHGLAQIGKKLSVRFRHPMQFRVPWPVRFKEPLSENLYTFHWSVEKVVQRLRDGPSRKEYPPNR